MLKKKEGFTLVEILGVIVILGLLLLLAFPTIINLVKNSTGDIDKATKDLIFSSTRHYIDKNINKYPITDTNVYCITLQTLVNSGDLIENLTNAKTGKKIDLNQVVKVAIENEANIDYSIVKESQCVEVICVPCPTTITDDKDNKTYKITQIGDQCWFAENLKYTGNGCLSKTWDSSSSGPVDACKANGDEIHYQWKAAMNGSTTEGAQGLCPSGWHIPTDAEWKILEGTVDSTYGVGNSVWDGTGYRGSDAGKKLKAVDGNGTDDYGFNGLLAGYRRTGGTLSAVGSYVSWWSSSPSGTNAWRRSVDSSDGTVHRGTASQAHGFSVRCVRD